MNHFLPRIIKCTIHSILSAIVYTFESGPDIFRRKSFVTSSTPPRNFFQHPATTLNIAKTGIGYINSTIKLSCNLNTKRKSIRKNGTDSVLEDIDFRGRTSRPRTRTLVSSGICMHRTRIERVRCSILVDVRPGGAIDAGQSGAHGGTQG